MDTHQEDHILKYHPEYAADAFSAHFLSLHAQFDQPADRAF